MNRSAFLAALIIISVFMTMQFMPESAKSAVSTTLKVSPSPLAIDWKGSDYPTSFTVDVVVTDVAGLSFWHIKLLFDPAILSCSNVVETPDGIFHGYDTIGLGVSIDNTAGYVGAYDGLWTTGGGFNGTGILCRIRFDVKQPGISSIAFTELNEYGGTIIYNNQFPIFLPFNPIDGFVQVNSAGFNASTFQVVREGSIYNVVVFTNSTISGFGYDQYNDMLSSVQTGPDGSVGACSTMIPDHLMNASYFGILVNGNATYFSVFTDGKNHFFVWTYDHSTVTISILSTVAGDLNADRTTDMKDVAITAYSFGSAPGLPRWNPVADINGDMKTDMKDVAFVAKYFGMKYQVP